MLGLGLGLGLRFALVKALRIEVRGFDIRISHKFDVRL